MNHLSVHSILFTTFFFYGGRETRDDSRSSMKHFLFGESRSFCSTKDSSHSKQRSSSNSFSFSPSNTSDCRPSPMCRPALSPSCCNCYRMPLFFFLRCANWYLYSKTIPQNRKIYVFLLDYRSTSFFFGLSYSQKIITLMLSVYVGYLGKHRQPQQQQQLCFMEITKIYISLLLQGDIHFFHFNFPICDLIEQSTDIFSR